MDISDFSNLLDKLKSPNNEERSFAEKLYLDFLSQNTEIAISYLIQFAENNQNFSYSLQSIILLKDAFIRCSQILLNSQNLQNEIINFLLRLISNPPNQDAIQFNISNLVMTAAKIFFANNLWPSFPNEILQRCFSSNLNSVSVSLDCLILSIYSKLIQVESIGQFLDQCYQNLWPLEPSYVHLLIIRLIFIYDKNHITSICFDDFIQRFPSFLYNLPPQIANSLISELITYSDQIVHFFGNSFQTLLNCFLEVLSDSKRDKGTRELIIEILAEICECSPNIMINFIQAIYSSLVKLTYEIDNINYLFDDDYEDSTPRTIVEKSFYRFAAPFCIGNNDEQNSFPSFLFELFIHLNQSSVVEEIRASYIILKQITSILLPFLQDGNFLEMTVQKIIFGFQSQNIFCQVSSLQALSKLAKELSPEFQNDYNSIFIQPLLELIKRSPTKYSVKALSSIVSGSSPENICKYIDPIYQVMFQVIGRTSVNTQIYAINCISSLNINSGPRIEEFYPFITNALSTIIQTNNIDLLIPAIEAFSMIGINSPIPEYISDSSKFLQLILSLNRENLTDKQNTSLNSALNAFAKVIGNEYPEQFLQLMAIIIHTIKEPLNIQKLPLSTDRSILYDSLSIPNLNENQLYVYSKTQIDNIYRSLINIETFLLEIDIEIFSQLLIQLLPDLFEGFASTISFYFDNSIQSETILCIDVLSTIISQSNFVQYNIFLPFLKNVIATLHNPLQNIDSLSNFIDILNIFPVCYHGNNCHYSYFLEIIEGLLEFGYDEDSLDIKDEIYSKVGATIKQFVPKEVTPSLIEEIQQLGQKYFPIDGINALQINPGTISFWANYAASISNDISLFNQIINFLSNIFSHPNNEIKQAVFMSFENIIHSDKFTEEHIQAILPLIIDFLSNSDLQNTEMKNIVDASVLSLSLLFIKFPKLLNDQKIVFIWYKALPMKGKKPPQFKCVYDVLWDLIEQKSNVILNDISHLLKIIVKAVKHYNASEQTSNNLKLYVKMLFTNENNGMQQILNQMSSPVQRAIYEIMNEDIQVEF